MTGSSTTEPEDQPSGGWKDQLDSLEIPSVIRDERAFKVQLGIGEDAFATLRIRNWLAGVWDVSDVAVAGGAVAGTNFVATTFFASAFAGGILGLFGLGAATAATPIGWVITAGAFTGSAYWFIRRKVLRQAGELVEVVPKFMNAPIDVLALALLDLMIPLALKIAAVDGEVHQAERDKIENHFVNTWGYEPEVVNFAKRFFEEDLVNFEFKVVAKTLVEFARQEPDCKFEFMIKSIMKFLRELSEADGIVHENEEFALNELHRVFKKHQSLF